jgi:DNA-binding NtrC family response regulator
METPGRILIIKLDEVDLMSLTGLLQGEGYQCTLVQDEIEMIKAFETNEYDLVIIEIQIFGDEELELVQTIQWNAPGMPTIIFYTSHPSLQSAAGSIPLPVASYLTKPVHSRVLFQYVKTSIANYKAFKRGESLLLRTIVYTWAIEETIQVLEATRSSFKSKKLAALRRQLEQILEGEQNEIREN